MYIIISGAGCTSSISYMVESKGYNQILLNDRQPSGLTDRRSPLQACGNFRMTTLTESYTKLGL